MIDLFKVSEIEIVYKPKIKASQRVRIEGSKQAYEVFRSNWDENKINYLEEFKVMLLSRSNRVLGISKVSQGGMSATVVDPKIIFSVAIKSAANSIIIAHNHPSGNLSPSEPDKRTTTKIIQAGKLLDIAVLDHIIVTDEGYYSFADHCQLH